ncbi:unnamed protein product [Ambrosiozyma monospora]|uniref:Unnamed protein product n=1 Tax=Ambrosiozyma monospora TaxID=43982 RepID=A0ACB5U8R1_AMBMO|nr:unnamed protein product [Ambrosiozyma monospora]
MTMAGPKPAQNVGGYSIDYGNEDGSSNGTSASTSTSDEYDDAQSGNSANFLLDSADYDEQEGEFTTSSQTQLSSTGISTHVFTTAHATLRRESNSSEGSSSSSSSSEGAGNTNNVGFSLGLVAIGSVLALL